MRTYREVGRQGHDEFPSICARVKHNRILPQGFLPLEQRIKIAKQFGADEAMAEEAGPEGGRQ